MTINPKSANLQVGGTQHFSADPGSTYSVQGQSGGKIDAQGNYTAGPRAGNDTVTCKSADGRTSDTATAVVTA